MYKVKENIDGLRKLFDVRYVNYIYTEGHYVVGIAVLNDTYTDCIDYIVDEYGIWVNIYLDESATAVQYDYELLPVIIERDRIQRIYDRYVSIKEALVYTIKDLTGIEIEFGDPVFSPVDAIGQVVAGHTIKFWYDNKNYALFYNVDDKYIDGFSLNIWTLTEPERLVKESYIYKVYGK